MRNVKSHLAVQHLVRQEEDEQGWVRRHTRSHLLHRPRELAELRLALQQKHVGLAVEREVSPLSSEPPALNLCLVERGEAEAPCLVPLRRGGVSV